MKCPVDQSVMVETGDKGAEYHECPGCKGVWIQERALRAIVAQIDPDAEFAIPRPTDRPSKRLDNDKPIKCPHDGLQVHRHKIGKVTVDICPACGGLWLDPGEFDAIKEELEKHELLNALERPIIHKLGNLIQFHWSDQLK